MTTTGTTKVSLFIATVMIIKYPLVLQKWHFSPTYLSFPNICGPHQLMILYSFWDWELPHGRPVVFHWVHQIRSPPLFFFSFCFQKLLINHVSEWRRREMTANVLTLVPAGLGGSYFRLNQLHAGSLDGAPPPPGTRGRLHNPDASTCWPMT